MKFNIPKINGILIAISVVIIVLGFALMQVSQVEQQPIIPIFFLFVASL